MRNTLLFILIIAFSIACQKDKEDDGKEIPKETIRTKPCPTLYSRIQELFPEEVNNKNRYPDLFGQNSSQKIILNRESEVYVTFIAERAGYKNSFGWFTYDSTNVPKDSTQVKLNILFPNVSSEGEGGKLKGGEMLQLGDTTFKAGTIIEFFIVVNGWQNNDVNLSYPKIYTHTLLNKSKTQQHVLFKEKTCGDIVLGLEDISNFKSDWDFNDILFTISDNRNNLETIAFDLNNVPEL